MWTEPASCSTTSTGLVQGSPLSACKLCAAETGLFERSNSAPWCAGDFMITAPIHVTHDNTRRCLCQSCTVFERAHTNLERYATTKPNSTSSCFEIVQTPENQQNDPLNWYRRSCRSQTARPPITAEAGTGLEPAFALKANRPSLKSLCNWCGKNNRQNKTKQNTYEKCVCWCPHTTSATSTAS